MSRGTRSWSTAGSVPVLILALIMISGCSEKPPEVTQAQAPEVLRSLVQDAAQPTLAELASSSRQLAAKIADLCAEPDAPRLAAARTAWRSAYVAWRRAGPFLFGPGSELSLDRLIGTWPANALVLEAVVRTDGIREMRLEPSVRGFAALEHLLFMPRDARSATGGERCEHLLDLGGEISRLSGETERLWRDGFGAWVASAPEAPGLGDADPLALALAQTLNLTENLLWQRIGVPSGFFRGDPAPDRLEAPLSGASGDGLLATLDGLDRLVSGLDGPGLAALVANRNPGLAGQLVASVRHARALLAPSDVPLASEIAADGRRLKGLYETLGEFQDLLGDTVDALALRVAFQEDGD